MTRIANDNTGLIEEEADDNTIQPFQLELSGIQGRVVRLGSVFNDIIEAHKYPAPVAYLIGEAMGLGLLLCSTLKYDGVFTLQTKTDGPVKMVVVDVTSAGEVRAYASFDEEILSKLEVDPAEDADQRYGGYNYAELIGKGYIAFTVDQGEHTERYQGIVAIEGDDLAHSVQHYFEQSEQIKTAVRVSAAKTDTGWRAGAMMLQKLPDEGGKIDETNVVALGGDLAEMEAQRAEDWTRSVVLMQTCTPEEFVDSGLHSSELLFRLFHEEGVRVFDKKPIMKGCRCSSDKVLDVLRALTPEEKDECFQDGNVEIVCEFCSKEYVFGRGDL